VQHCAKSYTNLRFESIGSFTATEGGDRLYVCIAPLESKGAYFSIFLFDAIDPTKQKFAANTALLHSSGVFLNVVGEMPREIRVIVDSVSDNRYRLF
jgi:hypothetical protein